MLLVSVPDGFSGLGDTAEASLVGPNTDRQCRRIPGVPDPLVSVVVSTYNRPARLSRLLGSLRGQSLAPEAFEVIVVDNGSDPATAELLAAEVARPGLELRLVRHEQTLGPAGGRNSGWRVARAPLVAFTDDDCAPDPEWLAGGLRAHAEHPDAVIQGITRPDPRESANEGPLAHTVAVDTLGPQYEACNVFYPRALLERLGGFDERYGLRPAGEDTDLAWRAIEHGAPTALAADAVVLHAVEPLGPLGMLRFVARWGDGVRVFSDHPGARAMLHRRVFWNVWHYLLWRSLLALAAPRILRRLIVARHLLELRRRARREGAGVWLIPLLVLIDAVECWSIARGAVRYRTFVL
jgi:glycosyltransferase involved in cell wall biosynthesis